MAISWKKQVIFDTYAVQIHNPVPELIQTITKLLPKNIVETELSLIITELYNNAVDHGLLDLSSEIKQQEQGLEKFYHLRKERLEDLVEGTVQLVFQYQPLTRILSIEVSDTGQGFDFDTQIKKPLMTNDRSGRGLYIIKNLAQDISYDRQNNTVSVQYRVRSQELSNQIQSGLDHLFSQKS